jgi:hypothetical protein
MQIHRYVRGTITGSPGHQTITVHESELAGLPEGSRVGIVTAILPLVVAVYYGAEFLFGKSLEEKALECLKAGGNFDMDTEECTALVCPEGTGLGNDNTCVPLPPTCKPGTHLVMGPGGDTDMRCVPDVGGSTPVTNPPVTNPPVTNPPVTNPPVTNPPAGKKDEKKETNWVLILGVGAVVVAGVGAGAWYMAKKKK